MESTEAITLQKQFMDAFETPRDPEFWVKMIEEEVAETEEALLHLFKEVADVKYVIAGYLNSGGDEQSLMYGTLGDRLLKIEKLIDDLVDGGPESDRTYRLVHESNMSKLGDDGKPVRREDGKVLKGPNYKAPDLSVLLRP